MGSKRRELSVVARIGAGLSLLVAAAPGCGEGEAGEMFGGETREIHNGTTATSNPHGVVAVYHQNSNDPNHGWYPRPCTGRVLNPSASNNYLVLTARHCVTPADAPGGGLEGPPLAASSIRVSAALSPGQFPPSNAAPGCTVHAPPSPNNGYLGLNGTLDLAIVRICQSIPGLSATSVPLFMSTTGDLEGEEVEAYGYGRLDGDGDDWTTGILRRSTGHEITNVIDQLENGDYNGYWPSKGPNDTYFVSGDSGGPQFWTGTDSRRVQVGVNMRGASTQSAGATQAVSRVTMQFVQAATQRLYIRPHHDMATALTRSGLQHGASISLATTSSVAGSGGSNLAFKQWFGYEFPSRHIVVPSSVYGTTCLRRNSNNTVQMNTCSDVNSQRWWVRLDNSIRTSDFYCLDRQESPLAVVVTPCDGSQSQKWYFDGDSRVSGVF